MELLTLALLPVTIVALIGTILIAIRVLAETNIFFTYVPEGRGRIILRNGKFFRAVLSYTRHKFRHEIGDEEIEYDDKNLWDQVPEDPWDIVRSDEEDMEYSFLNPLYYLKDIYWVGLPPFSDIYRHVFRWTSFEQQKGSTKRIPIPHEEPLDYFLAQDDVYLVTVEEAETAGKIEKLPVTVQILLTLRIVNPFKAFSQAQRWLELVTDQTDARVRRYIGETTYTELIDNPDSTTEQIGAKTADLKEEFLELYGIELIKTQILSVDPPENLRELTLAQYIAEQQGQATVITATKKAEARRIEADAEKTYINETLGAQVKHGGTEAIKWSAVRDSDLTTFVDAGGIEKRLVDLLKERR